MRLDAGCQLTFQADEPSPLLLMLRPRSGRGQWVVREEYLLDPPVPLVEYSDSYGNLCQRVMAPKGSFQVCATARVETADALEECPGAAFVPVQQLPDEVLQFLLPSRYCQSDQLGTLASEIVTTQTPGYDQVAAICTWIQRTVNYRYGTSDTSTSAIDTVNCRMGVCRDFAHLGMALCRSLCIPARMVVGYLYQLEPMDLHAWFEAFVGDRWYVFDATQQAPRGNRIAIAYGQDAANVALATQFGPIRLTEMQVWVETTLP